MTNFTFTNKAEYLEFRAQWKADYEAISVKQRQTKKAFNSAMKVHNSTHKYADWFILHTAAVHLNENKSALNQKLEDLKKAKARAAEQYLANKKSGESV